MEIYLQEKKLVNEKREEKKSTLLPQSLALYHRVKTNFSHVEERVISPSLPTAPLTFQAQSNGGIIIIFYVFSFLLFI